MSVSSAPVAVIAPRSPVATATVATMAFLVMLGSGVIMPAVRPFLGEQRHFSEGTLHAFMSVNMLGAAIGAPLAAILADRARAHRAVCIALALLDATLLGACTLDLSAPAILALRACQGAANVGVLSIVLSSVARDRSTSKPHTTTLGVAGAGIMLAVALGPAVGGALLRLGTVAPLRAAAALALVVASIAAGSPTAFDGITPRGSRRIDVRTLARDPLFMAPALLAFAERFTVGCFVVTFSLYAHDVRHLSDGETGLHYSLFLLPFALATYPFARGTERFPRGTMMTVGGVLYGITFLTFGWTSGVGLGVALMLAGLSSAMVYGPSLCCVAKVGTGTERATSMALFHAAGCLGMLLGPAAAGILSAILRHAGFADPTRYATVFMVAGAAQLAAVVALRSPLRRLREADAALERAPGASLTMNPQQSTSR